MKLFQQIQQIQSIEQYSIRQILNKGNSLVFHTYSETDSKNYAIKIIDKTNQQQLKRYLNEVAILKELNSSHEPQFVKLIKNLVNANVFYSDKTCSNEMGILLEYVTKGTLFDYIEKSERLSEIQARSVFQSIFKCVKNLHQRNIAHLDLKLENFLIDNEFNLKLCDFESSQHIYKANKKDKNQLTNCYGTNGYTAPEIYKLTNKFYEGDKADVFSLGVILFILCAKVQPFDNCNSPNFSFIRNLQFDKFFDECEKSLKMTFSDEFKDLFWYMISYNPHYRFTMTQIENHAWFNGESFELDF